MNSAPKILKIMLPRVTKRSLTAEPSPNLVVSTEYMAGKTTTRIRKLASELNGIRKLDFKGNVS